MDGDPKDAFLSSTTAQSSRRQRPDKTPKRSPSEGNDGESLESSSTRKIIDVACWPCRKRKGRCTGERPACASCVRREVQCSYEHEEGMTRQGSLRQKLDTATSRAQNLDYLFQQLRWRPDNEATLILAVIRLGADVDKLVERMRVESDLSWLTTLSGTSSLELPQIAER